jgi:hypothetical protein
VDHITFLVVTEIATRSGVTSKEDAERCKPRKDKAPLKLRERKDGMRAAASNKRPRCSN